ncbi:MAG: hypothetical protein Q4F97_09310 [Bacteroidales bacterium]|nr:hypothetical protein [Bacteroidales bacterium]
MRIKNIILIIILFSTSFSSFSQKNKDKKSTITPEETFINENFKFAPPSKWKPGYKFFYTCPEINITLKAVNPILNDTTNYQNALFVLKEFKHETDWGGESFINICFTSDDKDFIFKTGKSLQQFSDTLYNPLIPCLIWLDEIEKADSLLKNKTLYILNSNWNTDTDSNLLNAKKFVPVIVESVKPGNETNPVKIYFKDEKGETFFIYTMLSGTINSTSRLTFPKTFSFSDPRIKYKDINDEKWALITSGDLANGMNQNEIKLSIGKPNEIKRIPTYSGLKEQWNYNNGTMVFFEDGLVTKFRK